MARKYPFTRTISKQNVTALVFDTETAEAMNTTVTITPPIDDDERLAKAVSKKVETDNIKFIKVVDVTLDENVYGITLDDFMAHAVQLDPTTRKALAD